MEYSFLAHSFQLPVRMRVYEEGDSSEEGTPQTGNDSTSLAATLVKN